MNVDTLAMTRELRAAELPAAQAEAIAAAIGHAIAEGAATRADLTEAKMALGAKIDQFEMKVEAKLESLRSTPILWFIETGLTLAAVIIAAIKL